MFHPDALAHIVDVANGDARAALELAVETTPADSEGVQHLTLTVAEESIQRRAVLYDKEGDAHFDTISAFIKSVRGSDPDAALYWLAKMVYAGEEPRYIFRRLLILASEDVGLADPQALGVVEACAAAYDRVGLPEGRYHLAQATLYLAATKKSNSTMAFFDAINAVAKERASDVPSHLKDGNWDKEGLAMARATSTPTPTGTTGSPSSTCPTPCAAVSSGSPRPRLRAHRTGPGLPSGGPARCHGGRNRPAPVEQLTTGPTDKRLERLPQRTASQASQRPQPCGRPCSRTRPAAPWC